MSIWSDIKKGLKGSKEYQKGKAKRKAKRAKSPLGKAVKQVAKDVKSAVKGSKEYQAGKAKKKAGKTWTKAVKAQKKAGGPNLSTLVKARGMHKKGTAEYAKIQNQINKAYGSKVRHKAEAPKVVAKKVAPKAPAQKPREPIEAKDAADYAAKVKAKKAKTPKKVAPKVAPKKVAPKVAKPKEKVTAKEWHPPMADSRQDLKPKAPEVAKPKKTVIEPYPPREDQGPKFMEAGGKVESNPYGWPSSDSRKR